MWRIVVLAGTALLLLAGCGKSTTTTATTAGYGTLGNATKADRTIAVRILPTLKYDPAAISVRPGETVVFKVSNDTTGIHEFVLGDAKVQDQFQKMMTSMGNSPMMMADQANSLNLQPGQTKQLAWTFPSTSGVTVIYASHEPGDYAHGLKGLITVQGTPAPASPAVTGSSTTMPAMTSTTMGGMTSTTMPGMSSTTMGGMPGMTSTTPAG